MSWDNWRNFGSGDNSSNTTPSYEENNEDNLDAFLEDDDQEDQVDNNTIETTENDDDNSLGFLDEDDDVDKSPYYEMKDNKEESTIINSENHIENSSSDSSNDSDITNNDSKDNQDESDDEDSEDFDDIAEGFYRVPNNATNELLFSEKEMYQVVNVTKLLEECSEDLVSLVQTVFGFNAKSTDLKKAINIVTMDKQDFEAKTSAVTGLRSIYDASHPGEDQDPFEVAIRTISRVSSMEEEDRGNMITLARKISKETTNADRVTARKNQAAADIVSELRKSMTGEHSIADKVFRFDALIHTIKEAAR